jgi:hypothetical protein
MAIYSTETRLKLVKWVTYAVYFNILLVVIFAAVSWVQSGPSAAVIEGGKNGVSLLGFAFAAWLVQQKLRDPRDDFWRKFAEVLGSAQVCSACLVLGITGLFIVGHFAGLTGIIPGLGRGPVTTSGSPVAMVTLRAEPADCVLTSSGCIPVPPLPTIPPYGNKLWQDDPVIGPFVFEKSQFDPDENYTSRPGNSEYDFRVVPLDHSPEIIWIFRDDGIVLFYDAADGSLLRTGTWSEDIAEGQPGYRIKRGNREYRGSFEESVFRITRPDYWNMTKIEVGFDPVSTLTS